MLSEDNYFDQRSSTNSLAAFDPRTSGDNFDQRSSIDSEGYFRDEESRPFKTENEANPRYKPSPAKEENLSNVLRLALFFVLLFSAFNPAQNLLAVFFKQAGQDHIGVYSLMIISQCYGIASLISPLLVPKLTYKAVFSCSAVALLSIIIVGKLVNSCFIDGTSSLCQSDFIHKLVTVASILTGIGLGFIWVTSSVYIQECSVESNKGTMFGLFGTIYQFCNVFGSVISLTMIKHVDISAFFTCQIFLSMLAAFLFQTVKKPVAPKPKKDYGTATKNEEAITISKIIHFMNREKMRSCYPLFILYSFSYAFLVSNLSKMVNLSLQDYPANEVNLKVGYVLLTLSLSQIVSGAVCGMIFDKSKANALEFIIQTAFVTVVLNYIGYHWGSYYFFFPVAVCYGILDCGFQTVINALIGGRFTEKYEQFAVFRFVHGMSQSLFYLLIMILDNSIPQAMFLVYIFVVYYAWDNRKSLF